MGHDMVWQTDRLTNSLTPYLDFFFQLHLLRPYLLRLQGYNLSLAWIWIPVHPWNRLWSRWSTNGPPCFLWYSNPNFLLHSPFFQELLCRLQRLLRNRHHHAAQILVPWRPPTHRQFVTSFFWRLSIHRMSLFLCHLSLRILTTYRRENRCEPSRRWLVCCRC